MRKPSTPDLPTAAASLPQSPPELHYFLCNQGDPSIAQTQTSPHSVENSSIASSYFHQLQSKRRHGHLELVGWIPSHSRPLPSALTQGTPATQSLLGPYLPPAICTSRPWACDFLSLECSWPQRPWPTPVPLPSVLGTVRRQNRQPGLESSHTRCVTLDRLLNLYEPHFSRFYNENSNSTS